jgi:hypothetical protein
MNVGSTVVYIPSSGGDQGKIRAAIILNVRDQATKKVQLGWWSEVGTMTVVDNVLYSHSPTLGTWRSIEA